ncbi:MAG TPA: HAMP domain-containing sensor histidine kinase [Rhizomicrobium sp.]|nr:HAMP domain-containing sensor histidine kinase [Rhizomicrobium sp.]
MAQSLSGRLLLLTLLYVLVTEALIFVPTIARYHTSLLQNHIETAELAILPFTEPGGNQLSAALRQQLLTRAGAAAVMLKRADQRELFLVDEMPMKIDVTIDLTHENFFGEMYQALDCALSHGNRILHVISATRIKGAQAVEVIIGERPIRTALIRYARQIVLLGLLLSFASAFLVFISLYLVFVRPMGNLTRAMTSFHENPEDPARIVQPSSRRDEIGIAERELAGMQRDIYGFLQQKARLAALGTAVAKIQHDLRNILSSAQLASDRLASVDDPVVQRVVPRLVLSLDHAVALATNTLRYGRADEAAPQRRQLYLAPVVAEAAEAALESATSISFENRVDPALMADADPEQLYRIVLNILRNAREALGEHGAITVDASRSARVVRIEIADNGPGIPEKVRERLFQPFAGTTRPGGSGLGLAIARDLARVHGGDIELVSSDAGGTRFCIAIPDHES